MEQYKLLEERRKTFGNQFMQIIGFFVALFALTIGVLGVQNSDLLSLAMLVSGFTFIIIAHLGYRLGKRQDDCEKEIAKIEKFLGGIINNTIASLPRGAKKFGARGKINSRFLNDCRLAINIFLFLIRV